ncbi:UNKNOWN [Stylonychia lemnae]|uniref:Uncharacterized protein n=1 Tax=Stylonychia lemnae TaxID=5949 RepID=A0A078A8B8_STYLE|nr:UNKNOWN [Stylonychia lemnae]|eukprot:CDW78469.1 UNKNOWN [Stylonychia lemnae]
MNLQIIIVKDDAIIQNQPQKLLPHLKAAGNDSLRIQSMIWAIVGILQTIYTFYLFFNYYQTLNRNQMIQMFQLETNQHHRVEQISIGFLVILLQVVLTLIVATFHSILNLPSNLFVLYKTIKNDQGTITAIPKDSYIFYMISITTGILAVMSHSTAFTILLFTYGLMIVSLFFVELIILLSVAFVVFLQTMPSYTYKLYLESFLE